MTDKNREIDTTLVPPAEEAAMPRKISAMADANELREVKDTLTRQTE